MAVATRLRVLCPSMPPRKVWTVTEEEELEATIKRLVERKDTAREGSAEHKDDRSPTVGPAMQQARRRDAGRVWLLGLSPSIARPKLGQGRAAAHGRRRQGHSTGTNTSMANRQVRRTAYHLVAQLPLHSARNCEVLMETVRPPTTFANAFVSLLGARDAGSVSG